MKKWMLLLTAALLSLSLCSCGTEQPEEGQPFVTGDVQTLYEGGVFSEELEELDADVAFALYRLGEYDLVREDLTEAVLLRSAGATCEEGGVLIFDGEDKAAAALTALTDYLQNQVDSNVNYRSDEIPKLEAALLEQRENTVLLAVCDDSAKAQELLGLN